MQDRKNEKYIGVYSSEFVRLMKWETNFLKDLQTKKFWKNSQKELPIF